MLLALLFVLIAINAVSGTLKLSTNLIALKVGQSTVFQLHTTNEARNISNSSLTFVSEHDDILQVSPTRVLVRLSSNVTNSTYNISVVAIKAGKSGVIISRDPSDPVNKEPLFLLVHVYKSSVLQWVSKIVGWLYFISWSLYYYPQIYTNYKRKSVIGLNFDYLLFGVFGYGAYGAFNIGLYFIPAIQEQYSQMYPRSIIPVQPNDLFSSSHSFLAFVFTVFQCLIYERGDQKISVTAKIMAGIYILLIILFIVLALYHILLWLDVLYLCSYIKLCINLTYYMPQVYMNYKRKSTKGWNIGGAMLDVTGGFMSILQMVLDGYNFANWNVVFENPTKFGMGLLTMGFSTLFMVQHFILYAEN